MKPEGKAPHSRAGGTRRARQTAAAQAAKAIARLPVPVPVPQSVGISLSTRCARTRAACTAAAATLLAATLLSGPAAAADAAASVAPETASAPTTSVLAAAAQPTGPQAGTEAAATLARPEAMALHGAATRLAPDQTPAQTSAETPASRPAPTPAQAPMPAPATASTAWRLPEAAAAERALRDSPAITAAWRRIEAERLGAQQARIGPEWTLSAALTQRNAADPATPRAREWELGLDRPWRSARKLHAQQALGLARLAQAEAAWASTWREQATTLLDRWTAWQRDRAIAQWWQPLARLTREQADAVRRRLELGDAAALEATQSEAAMATVLAQSQAAVARAAASRAALEAAFPSLLQAGEGAELDGDAAAASAGLLGSAAPTAHAARTPATPPMEVTTSRSVLPSTAAPADPPSQPATAASAATSATHASAATHAGSAAAPRGVAPAEADLAQFPEVLAARHEALVAEAWAEAEAAEQRPDPTIGLRWGGTAGATAVRDRALGVVLSLPFGGEARRLGAQAAAVRAEAAWLALQEAQRRARSQHEARRREAEALALSSQRLREAAGASQQAADALARGYALGEGSLAEVLAARRLAIEQGLAALQMQQDAQALQARIALDAGRLWPVPDASPARGSAP